MRGNIIKIHLSRGRIGQAGTLSQWDRGQRLIITGCDLPDTYEVHFSNEELGRSKPMIGDSTGVGIPDEYLQSGKDVHVWVYVVSQNHAETEYHGIIKVTPRAEPTDIEPTPAQKTVIDQTIELLEDAVEKTNENVHHYPYVNEDGYWMVYDADAGEFVNSGTKGRGEDGKDGDPRTLLDDTAGDGETEKTWSADKLVDEFSLKADKADTVLDTTLSRGRAANSTVGAASFAFGYNVEASGMNSHAEGSGTIASNNQAHAEGFSSVASGMHSHAENFSTASGTYAHSEGAASTSSGIASHSEGFQTTASGSFSHAEGQVSTALGNCSHAEGSLSAANNHAAHAEGNQTTASGVASHSEGMATIASGAASHAEGYCTVAYGNYSSVSGRFNYAGTEDHSWPEWTANSEYNVGDKVTFIQEETDPYTGDTKMYYLYYICTVANSGDDYFDPAKWDKQNVNFYSEIVGNGADKNNLSNARALDWNGNEYLAGDVYVGCNSDSSGGSKLAKLSELPDVSHFISDSEKGSANGIAELDATGRVPSNQLPSYVDDVIEYPSLSDFPEEGESGKIYIALDTNVTYRWSGSTYAEVGTSLTLGETENTAYRGDRGKVAYDHASAKGSAFNSGLYKVATNAEGHVIDAVPVVKRDIVDLGIPGDISTKAEKSGTILETTLSMGRKAGTTLGARSTALGSNVTAKGNNSFATGANTTAQGHQSHAEGNNSAANGDNSHAEGINTLANGNQSHAEGSSSVASGNQAHSEGTKTTASGNNSHAEGNLSEAIGYNAHAEGNETVAEGTSSHAEGTGTIASNKSQHVGGEFNIQDPSMYIPSSRGEFVEIIGNGTDISERSNARALDWNGNEYLSGDLYVNCNDDSTGGTKVVTTADISTKADKADTVLDTTLSRGRKANTTVGTGSFAFGDLVEASGEYSHVEGYVSVASGRSSHAEGISSIATGTASHAEGNATHATGGTSHAEGSSTNANGRSSHAEGSTSTANGYASHAEGSSTANGGSSHAEGVGTIADGTATHTFGAYNVSNNFDCYDEWEPGKEYLLNDVVKVTDQQSGTVTAYLCHIPNNDSVFDQSHWWYWDYMKFVEIVGNGTETTIDHSTYEMVRTYSNARALDWSGNEYLSGDLYVNCNSDSTGGTKVATVSEIPDISGKADKADTVLDTTLSRGRKANTTIGTGSFAFGNNVEASGNYSHAEGYNTKALGNYSHAEGHSAKSNGNYSHAEGQAATANGTYSHAEGIQTAANGYYSHAEGILTTADGSGTHASGILNLPNNYDCYPEWVPNTQYVMNDKVKITSQSGEVVAYLCSEANADSSFDTNHWAIYDYMNYIEIVGNGYQELISKYDTVNHYSNARTLDRNGNEYLNGDIYINCNSDSTGGSKVLSLADFATDTEVQAIISGWEVGA